MSFRVAVHNLTAMNIWQEFLIAAAIIVSMALQFGEHPLSWRRVLLPLVIVGGFAVYYLKAIPTSGNDGLFTLGGAVLGLALGTVAAMLMRVRLESGRVILSAGIAYVALWVIVFGARFAFALVATNSPDTLRQLFIWTYEHGITETGWVAALMLQAITMVGIRTLVVMGRSVMVAKRLPAMSAL